MTLAIKIRRDQFQGGAGITDAGPKGLGAVLKGLITDNSRRAVKALMSGTSPPGYTNSTTGATLNPPALTALSVPAVFNATSAGGSTLASVQAALGTVSAAIGEIGQYENAFLAVLGLDLVTGSILGTGTLGTISAVTKTSAAGTGNATATQASLAAAATSVRNDVATLTRAANRIAVAQGAPKLPDLSGGSASQAFALSTISVPALVASMSGGDSVAKTDVDAFLLACANDLSNLADFVHGLTGLTTAEASVVFVD